jgi:cytochrome c oxidase subunit 4
MTSHELDNALLEEQHFPHEHTHPGARTYIEIAAVLAVITLVEVGIFYLPDLHEAFRPFLLPAFLILSTIKFVLVVGFYMHLKFDDPFFLRLFGFALVIAMTVVTAIIALFHGLYF